MYAISNMILLCQGWIYEMIAIWNIAHVYSYVRHDIFMSRMKLQNICHIQNNISMSRMNLRNVYFYVKDESTKCMLMSNMIFLCQGWIYIMIAICNIALVYSYVRHDIFMSRMNLRNAYVQHEILMSRMNLRNVCIIQHDILMSRMNQQNDC